MFNLNKNKILITSPQIMKDKEEILIIKEGDRYKELYIPTYLRRNKINVGDNKNSRHNWKSYDESMRLIKQNRGEK